MADLRQPDSPTHRGHWIPRILAVLRPAGIVGGYLAATAVLCILTLPLEISPGIGAWYLSSGLSLTLLLVFGVAYAPAILAAEVISAAWIWHLEVPPLCLLILGLIPSVFYAVAALILQRILQISLKLRGLWDVGWFVVAAIITPLFAALLSTLCLATFGVIPWTDYFNVVINRWLGVAIGILILTPFLLANVVPWARAVARWVARKEGAQRPPPINARSARTLLEVVALTAITIFALWLAFQPPTTDIHLAYLCFVPLIWAATRYGLPGVTTKTLAITIGATLAVHILGLAPGPLVELQTPLLALSITGLFLGTVISERRRTMAAALRESEEQYRTLFEESKDAVFITSREGTFIAINQAGRNLFGYSTGEIIGLDVRDVYADPNDRGRFQQEIEEHGFVRDYEVKLRRKDGTALDCLLSATVRCAEDGSVLGYRGIIRDVTQLRRDELALRESEARFRRLAENAQDLIYRYRVAPTPGFEYVSPAVTAITGYTPEEHYADPLLGFKLVHPEDQSLFRDMITEADVSRPLVLRWVRKDGQIIWTEQRNVPVYDEDGNLVVLEGIVRDITERKLAEEALERRTEELGLLYAASHQLSQSLDLETMYETLYTLIARIMDCDGLFISSYSPEDDLIRCVCAWNEGEQVDVSNLPPIPLEPEDYGAQSIVIRTRKPLLVPDFVEQLRKTQTSYHVNEGGIAHEEVPDDDPKRTRSAIIAPLKHEERVSGVVQVFSYRIDAYTEDDLRILEALAGHVSVATTNALLYQQAQNEITERKRAEAALTIQHDLAVALSSTSDLQEALDRLLETILQIGELDCGGVYLVDEQTGALDLVAYRGLEPQFVAQTSHFDADSPQARLVVSKGPIYLPYAEVLSIVGATGDEVRKQEDLRTLAAIPVLYEGKVVAILNLSSHEHDQLSANTRHVVESIAAQIGGVIARVKAEEARQRLNRQLTGLLGLAAGLEQTGTPEGLAIRLTHALAARLGYVRVSIWILEDDTLKLLGEASREELPSPEPTEVTVEEGVIGRVARTAEPAFVPNVQQDPDYFGKLPSIRSEICYPLRGTAGVIGVFDVESSGVLTETDAGIVKAAAQLASTALTNAQLFGAVRRHAEQLEALQQVSADLVAVRDLDSLLRLIVERAMQLLDADGGGIYLYRPECQGLAWVTGFGEGADDNEVIVIGRGEGLSGRVWETGEPQMVNDYESWADKSPQWTDFPQGAVLSVPIQWGDEFLGALNVHVNRAPHQFTSEDAVLLSQFAMQAAIAIQNARLYEELEAYSDLLERAVAVRTAELNAARERAETIFASVGDQVIVADLEGIILTVNPSFEQQTGYTAEEVAGRNIRMLLSDTTPPEIMEQMQQTVRNGESWIGEMEARRKDGSAYDAQVSVAPMRDMDGQLIGQVSSVRDVTQQRELARLKDEFVSNVSHELRTPISSLKLYHKLIEMNPDKYSAYMERLQRETDRLEHIIEDLLFLSRIDQGQTTLHFGPVDLNDLGDTYFSDREPLATSRKLTLGFSGTPDLPTVEADEGLVGQALSILMTNAFNYTPAGGRVTVSTHTREAEGKQWVGISVSDTGPGIPADELPHLFERFFRGKVGRESGAPGTGLGLSIVKEIMDRHGGQIEVTSERVPGQGTTFTIWLRASEPRGSARTAGER